MTKIITLANIVQNKLKINISVIIKTAITKK